MSDKYIDTSVPKNISATLAAGDLEIGAMEVKNAVDDTRAVVGLPSAISEASNVVGVHIPVLGSTLGAALDADGTGTIQQYLRGLLKAFISRIPTDPAKESGKLTEAVAVLGTVDGAAVNADSNGAIQQYLRGLIKAFADLWDGTNHLFKVGQATAENLNAIVYESGAELQPDNTVAPVLVSLSGSTACSTVLSTGWYYIQSTTDCYFLQGGSTVVATTSSRMLKAGDRRLIYVTSVANAYIAAITPTAGITGTLSIEKIR